MDTVRWCLSFPVENEMVREVWMSTEVGSPKLPYTITDWNVIQKTMYDYQKFIIGSSHILKRIESP
jgi:hypothetical protein